ncbi:MAG: MFS transporter [Promethearchaeota archaeon]
MENIDESENTLEIGENLKSQKKFSRNSFQAFLFFWSGQLFSILGSNIVSFVIIWTITELAPNNNTVLSIAAFLAFIPFVVFVPIAGVIADKWNKKYLILISDSLQALLTLIYIIILALGNLQIWHIYVIGFLRGTCAAFHEPVSFSVLSIMTPKDKLSRMNGLNTLFSSLVRIIAPVIAGFLMIYLDTVWVLSIDIITFLIALVPIIYIAFPNVLESSKESSPEDELKEKSDSKSDEKDSFLGHLKEGFTTIRNIPGLMMIMLMATLSNFFFQPLDALLPNFIRVTHSGGQQELSYFLGFLNVGVFLGAIIMTVKKHWRHMKITIIVGLFSTSAGLLALGLVPPGNFIALYIVAGLFLIMNPIVNGLFQTMIVFMIPPEKMGRVISVLITMSSIASPLGLIIAGPSADLLGSIPLLYIICGILSALVVLLTMFRKSALKMMKEGQRLQDEAMKAKTEV